MLTFSNGSEIFEVGVNQTVSLMITNSVPSDSWNGSIMETNVSLVARNELILQFSFRLEVIRAPGWSISSKNADLEIEPEGPGMVNLRVPPRLEQTVHGEDAADWDGKLFGSFVSQLLNSLHTRQLIELPGMLPTG